MKLAIEIPNRVLLATSTLLFGVVLGFGVARAAIPADDKALVYSGVLADASGPIDGDRTINVQVFADDVSTTPLCESDDQQVTLSSGHFRIALPASCATAVRGDTDAFVSVKVGGNPVGDRTRIAAVPFAVEAGLAVEAKHSLAADNATTAANATNATNATNAEHADDVATVTGWQRFNPVFTVGGALYNGVDGTGTFRRVGDSIEVVVQLAFLQQAVPQGNFGVDLPTVAGVPFTADLSRLPPGANPILPGFGTAEPSGVFNLSLQPFLAGDGRINLSPVGQQNRLNTNSGDFSGANSFITFTTTIPVTQQP